MPAYHSKLDDTAISESCGCGLMPLKTSIRGPAPPCDGDLDVVDEAINYYRANVLFKNFEVQGPADRTLIYLTLFIGQCIKACERIDSKSEAKTTLYQTAIKSFTVPGDVGWSLGSLFPSPKGREESDTFKAYFKQARQEVGERILDKIYDDEGKKNKWWFCFSKRKFMGKELRS
mmetsp:Transcript_19707/g.41201  ORF Transcript_19707/g.41201 Transcript_19707/m.41201 type:complete len:175 (+) Transcript_19707:101-625(+)